MLVAFAGMSLTSRISQSTSDPCGMITLGKYKLDLSRGAANMEIPKAMLTQSLKSGLSFAGTAKCPGAYEIINMQLTIDAARDAKYAYEFDFVKKLQSMEDYMLVRYFNDAEILHFNNIQVKNSAGEISTLPIVTVVVK